MNRKDIQRLDQLHHDEMESDLDQIDKQVELARRLKEREENE